MKISFCLAGLSRKPVGGYKIVFEYANRFTENGHEVTIVFNRKQSSNKYKIPEILYRSICVFLVKKHPKWFTLNKRVKKIFVKDSNYNEMPDGDIMIATSVETAQTVSELAHCKGRKVYFIQGFENWQHTDEEVFNTYKLNMKKIVISKWLKVIVDSKSQCPSSIIPNGIDFKVFGVDIPIQQRNTHSIAMLFHKGENKGSKYGLEAINRVKEFFPDLEVRLFGVPQRPKDLPYWIKYTQSATQEQLREIYNKSTVFICSSIEEGFGLTGAESMACGCALVSTSFQGVFEYAENNKNALLSPVEDVNALFNNIIRLFSDNDLRIMLATEGERNIKKFSWDNSVTSFESTMKYVLMTQ